jgi:hypothetical protein
MTKQTKTGLSFKAFDHLLMKNQDIKEEPGIYRSKKKTEMLKSNKHLELILPTESLLL